MNVFIGLVFLLFAGVSFALFEENVSWIPYSILNLIWFIRVYKRDHSSNLVPCHFQKGFRLEFYKISVNAHGRSDVESSPSKTFIVSADRTKMLYKVHNDAGKVPTTYSYEEDTVEEQFDPEDVAGSQPSTYALLHIAQSCEIIWSSTNWIINRWIFRRRVSISHTLIISSILITSVWKQAEFYFCQCAWKNELVHEVAWYPIKPCRTLKVSLNVAK